MSINKAIVSGNLTRDAELRSTAGGMSVANFSIAVNERMKNSQTGEWEDRPNFLDCTMFGKRAESLSKYLLKGTKVAVEGRLRWSQWENKDGEKRAKVEIVVDEVELMAGREKAEQMPQKQSVSYAEATLYDEAIPF